MTDVQGPRDRASDRAIDHYSPLMGSPSQVESPRYRCPVASCHQQWHRHATDDPIPHCPIHDLALVRDSKAH